VAKKRGFKKKTLKYPSVTGLTKKEKVKGEGKKSVAVHRLRSIQQRGAITLNTTLIKTDKGPQQREKPRGWAKKSFSRGLLANRAREKKEQGEDRLPSNRRAFLVGPASH